MIKIENTVTLSADQWDAVIRGMRNPMNSWEKSDSFEVSVDDDNTEYIYSIGPNDKGLMMRLAKNGPVHAKYRRMITVYVDITAPLYWWKEFDTYRVGVYYNPTEIEMNSCSTMHKIHAKEFTLEDFSCEHLIESVPEELFNGEVSNGVSVCVDDDGNIGCLAVVCSGNYNENHSYKDALYVSQKDILDMFVIPALNANRKVYLKYDEMIKNGHGSVPFDKAVVMRKNYWWQMIQLLPSSYNQKRTVMLNYEVLNNIYHSRKNHKLDEWREVCNWIEGLPYSEIITGERTNENNQEKQD